MRRSLSGAGAGGGGERDGEPLLAKYGGGQRGRGRARRAGGRGRAAAPPRCIELQPPSRAAILRSLSDIASRKLIY